ncbi:MAG TPA: carboxypeptidase regulatory-like domain-containing protein [Pyrinomonadaceae bacterium]|nr:carboxypeptidase regulatory-like domain-containing protein [Pyrinomonadaceae bacterium]
MFSAIRQNKTIIRSGLSFVSLVAFFASFVLIPVEVQAKAAAQQNRTGLGVIKGIVRDEAGNPIADAMVAVFHVGTSKLLKQVRSAADGSFLTKIVPGTYTVLAVAQGFNPVTLSEVQVNRSAELTYGFKLERSGSGNTLPEKRVDRNSSKWVIRAAQNRRSIYQNQEGENRIDENAVAENDTVEQSVGVARQDDAEEDETETRRKGQTVVETFVADSPAGGAHTGFNFATLQPLGENTEIIIVGQTGTTKTAPQRFETTVKFRPNESHQLRLTTSAARLGRIEDGEDQPPQQLGQFSFQALDEWKVREGVVLVFGIDYSRFLGASDDFSISPRFGLQFDVDARTRLRTAFTTQTEERTWSHAIELEDSSVVFRDQFSSPVVAFEDDKPTMNKSRRLEFGVERILDNKSSIEGTVFFDSVSGRGVGLVNLPFNLLSSENTFVASQQGKTQGVRFVYSRRLNGILSASAGYAFGKGQKLSAQAVTNPADIFENDFFQTFVGQLNASLSTGTKVKTIFRLSPDATVFAIDPFQGRLAIYDPSLSVMVTQSLPSLGLPIRAEAMIDARNLFDNQTGVSGEEGSLRLGSQRRTLRGGISVRF